ncbi:MAG: hypothetical protein ABFS42_13115 [Candidatus Krumholzibacteriota bacterium]
MRSRILPIDGTRAARAALVAFLLLAVVTPCRAWSEFGAEEKAAEPTGPEIREPFFEFLLGMAESDSLGAWTGQQLRAHAAALGRESRFPLEEVVSLARSRPDSMGERKYMGTRVRAVWTLVLKGSQDRPMPYSILGYHPGSLRIGGVLVLSELAPSDIDVAFMKDDERITRRMTEVRIFPLEKGYVLLDADGFLDAILGSALDDAWTLGFVIGREKGKLIGLGVSLGREGRRIYGEFDFTQDKVMVHGRRPMSALSRASRRWLNVEDGNLPEPWIEN